MRTELRGLLAVAGGFGLMFPVAVVADATNAPLFNTWALAHGAFLFAWPLLGALAYTLLGRLAWFRQSTP